MRKWLLSLAAVGALTFTADAGWNKMDGQQVPNITAKEWFNTGKSTPDTSSLRGKVYLIEFFATW